MYLINVKGKQRGKKGTAKSQDHCLHNLSCELLLPSVAYRQFVRLVWEYVGKSNRLPLPCCVYNAIKVFLKIQCAKRRI